ncbi:hypothetical protein VTI74DRAFT_11342 [Chaetomium olivicolor]
MTQDELPTVPNGEASPGSSVEGPALPLRRSGRMRKRPSSYSEDADYREEKQSIASQSSPKTRRNPKRKVAPETFDVPDHLLEASLAPWRDNEQSEWPSWVELESDPAFFTAILGLLGVKGARIEEVLSVDEDSLATLPPPVYGLVFLYSYVEEDSVEAETASQDVWFANQTTHNACATIALLNIIMNAEDLTLGEKLRKLKQESMDLSPPLRGNMISNSKWIRTAHNSFARRLDLLNSALALQNQVDKRKKRAKSSSLKAKKMTKRKARSSGAQSDEGTAYHFIAFVPVGQKVWQLDGLQRAPVCIGEYQDNQHWTSVMRPVLEERMMRYETEQLSFSLLALCGDNLVRIRQKLAANIRFLEDLETKHSSNQDWKHKEANPDTIYTSTDDRLSAYQLTSEEIMSMPADDLEQDTNPLQDPSSNSSNDNPDETIEAALGFWEKHVDEQKRLRSEYEIEQKMVGQEPPIMIGRTKDYTAAIHEWVKKLAEHGVLKQLHEEAKLFTGM